MAATRPPSQSAPGARRRGIVAHALRSAAVVALAGACSAGWSPPEPEGRERTDPLPRAGVHIGAAACADCHASYDGHYTASVEHADCESCHGPAQRHAHTARAADIRHPSNADCERCHRVGSSTLLHWATSPHARGDVLCSDCHDTHGREPFLVRRADALEEAIFPTAGTTTQLCAGCHPEIAAEFHLPSHHPLAEGMIECSDCHAPHAGGRTRLGAETRRCTTCHQEFAGPWVFEHAPVAEDCQHCHTPHGASADFLLEAPQPAACINCHTLPISGAVHEPWAFTTRCTDCHSAVHGSFTDPVLRR